jgi:ketosteroid isomerase-like protein
MAACSGLRVDPAVVELGAEGDMAFVLSTYANEVRSERGDVVPTSGNQLAVWSLSEDGWRVVASCVTDVVSTPDINYKMQ